VSKAEPEFDKTKAHRYFAVTCFNKAWDLIDKRDRTAEENEEMIRLTQASIWHWTQREDCKSTNLSIGYWQASRVYALIGRIEDARRYGELCLMHSHQEEPFHLGYAYEALARAESLAGNKERAGSHLANALRLAHQVVEADERKALMDDLNSIEG
jgi:tetratricopeptide (TPR) repeat protein